VLLYAIVMRHVSLDQQAGHTLSVGGRVKASSPSSSAPASRTAT
jgi:hypothetical protein